jgi:hypothetical protein
MLAVQARSSFVLCHVFPPHFHVADNTVRSFPWFFSLDATLQLSYVLDGDVGSIKLLVIFGVVLPLNMKIVIFLAILLPALILSIHNGESRETYKVGSGVTGVDWPLTERCIKQVYMAYHVTFS